MILLREYLDQLREIVKQEEELRKKKEHVLEELLEREITWQELAPIDWVAATKLLRDQTPGSDLKSCMAIVKQFNGK